MDFNSISFTKELEEYAWYLVLHRFGTESEQRAHSLGKGMPFPNQFPICFLVVCYLLRTRVEKTGYSRICMKSVIRDLIIERNRFSLKNVRMVGQSSDKLGHFR